MNTNKERKQMNEDGSFTPQHMAEAKRKHEAECEFSLIYIFLHIIWIISIAFGSLVFSFIIFLVLIPFHDVACKYYFKKENAY